METRHMANHKATMAAEVILRMANPKATIAAEAILHMAETRSNLAAAQAFLDLTGTRNNRVIGRLIPEETGASEAGFQASARVPKEARADTTRMEIPITTAVK